MTDDTHMASRLGVEAAQGIHGMLQRFAAQGSEALVDEEGIYGELGADVAECKCQGERDEEAFTARKGAGGSTHIALIGIFQRYDEGAGYHL